MNAINVIAPYKHHGMWVFDDPRVGLVQEPFVAGADTMIDRVVADIPDAERGFTLIFSSTPFPGHQHRLDWRRAEDGGNWYYAVELNIEGWFAPPCYDIFRRLPNNSMSRRGAVGLLAALGPVRVNGCFRSELMEVAGERWRYSHPRSPNTERSTPGGAYHPAEP